MRPFWKDQQGNIAVIFGIALVPLISAVGMAIDYSRAVNARTALQTALDSAALMISRDASSMDPSEITFQSANLFQRDAQTP